MTSDIYAEAARDALNENRDEDEQTSKDMEAIRKQIADDGGLPDLEGTMYKLVRSEDDGRFYLVEV
jgi:hypothetical protein